MTEERKIVIPVVVDGSTSKGGFADVKQGAADMAQAVGKSAQEAGKAIDGIGASTEKLNAGQIRTLESLKRTAIRTTEGTAALKEYQAAQAGITTQAAPYIAKLREAEQGQVQLGMSAKATSAALRGVPAQFTDIITSLQGGQRPLQVFLQQGGQLKDMFGGAGNAARALGGYVLGLINPLTLTIAAAAGLAFVLNEGSGELRAFQKEAIITGNAIGVSASQFASLRDSIGGIATKGKAAEVLTEIAATGKIAGGEIRGIAEAAILMEKATGQATAKTVAQFAELAKSPVDAAIKLNEQYNFLTTAVFKQIKALEEQGRATQAAELAEKSFADALKTRATAVLESAGIIEKAWRSVTGAAKGAWDAMLNVGRALSPAEKAGAAAADVARIQAQILGIGAFGSTGGGAATGGASASRKAALEQELEASKKVLAEATRRVEIEQRNTYEKAEQNRLEQLGIAFTKQGDEFLTKEQRMRREVTKATVEGQELVKAGLITEKELRERIANVREKFKESGAAGTGENEVKAIRAKVLAAQQELARLQSGTPDAKLTEGEKLVIRIKEELTTTIKGQARAEKEKALVAAQSLAVVDRQVLTEQNYQKALKASEEALNKQVDAAQKAADSITEQAIQQEAVNANFGKSKTAIEQATLAQLKNQQAMAEASDRFSPAYVAAVNNEVAAQERKVKALQQAEFLQRNANLDESARALTEETRTLELQLSLMGRTQLERDKIIGQRQVEVKLAKELAEIEKLNLGAGPEADAKRAELRAKAAANAVIEGNNVASKAVLDEWQRTADSINQSLTDALLRGFESGKGFAQNLRDTLVNMFKTLVLRPIIQGVMAPVSGMVSQGINGLIGGGGGGIGNISSLFGGSGGGIVDSVAGLFGGGSGIAGAGITAAETAATIAATSEGLIAAGATVAEATAAAGALGGTMAAGAAGIGSAITAGLAAIGPIGWAALAATAIYAMASGGGGPKSEGGFAPGGLNIGGIDIGGNLQGSQRGDVAAAQKISQGISASYAALAKQLGLVNDKLDVGIFFSQDNAEGGTSLTQLQVTSSAGYDRSARLGGIENVARGDQALQQALAEETVRALVDGLKASDLGAQYKDILNALTEDAGAEAMQTALNRVSTARSQQMALEESLFQLTATDTEKLARTREMERAAIDPLNKALLESVYVQQDLKLAAEKANNVAKERAGLERQILQLQGDTPALRALELAGLDESNRALQQRIYALQDEAAAAKEATDATQALRDYWYAQKEAQFDAMVAADQAAREVQNAWKQTGDSIAEYMKALRGELTGNKAATLGSAQSQFAIATAQARAGDQKAADSLPTLAKAVQELALGTSSTRIDYARIVAATVASLEQTLGTIAPRAGLPSFDVGTPFVQQTGTAVIHQGEAILPAVAAQRWRDSGGNAELVAEVRALREKLEAIEKNTGGTARSTDRSDKVLQDWSRNGAPVINQPDTTLA